MKQGPYVNGQQPGVSIDMAVLGCPTLVACLMGPTPQVAIPMDNQHPETLGNTKRAPNNQTIRSVLGVRGTHY